MRVIHDGAPIDGLYAIGDSTGRGAFTHVAVWQARVLIAQLLERDEPFGGYHGLAWATFTDPEVGRVGLTEAAGARAGHHGAHRQRADRLVHARLDPRPRQRRPRQAGRGRRPRRAGRRDRGRARTAARSSALLTLAVHAEVPTAKLASMHYVYPTLHRTVLDAVRDLVS